MGWFADFITRHPAKRFAVDHMSRYRRDIAGLYQRQKQLEFASLDELEHAQSIGLRRLGEAAMRSPYYKQVFEALGKPAASCSLQDLRLFPFLTKEILRTRETALRIPGADRPLENFSGGSTGIPIRFYQDYPYRVQMSVSTRLCNELAGAFTGARMAKLWGAPQDRRQIEGFWGRSRLWMLNMRYYDSFDMSPDRMQAYHAGLDAFRPDLIQSYASSIFLLARFLKERGIRPNYPRRSIITAAEKLFPHMRAEIEEVFQVPVFDRYGSREVSAMAAECGAHQGLHVQMPGYIVETIDPATGRNVEEQLGEIVITVLNNFAMPFLRYRIGDMGKLTRKPCPCGRNTVRLQEIAGRTSDNFLMPDGRVVHGEYFTHLFYGRDGIEQFQFVQKSRDEFTLRIVPSGRYRNEMTRLIENEIREMIGAHSKLRIEIHESIPKTATGKYRFTISEVGMEELIGADRP